MKTVNATMPGFAHRDCRVVTVITTWLDVGLQASVEIPRYTLTVLATVVEGERSSASSSLLRRNGNMHRPAIINNASTESMVE